jgi:4a-hydroxytetrahydrobiopterin dehydratase
MTMSTMDLRRQHCQPCEGDVPALTEEEAWRQLEAVPNWQLSSDGKHIWREWTVKDFAAGLRFLRRVGDVAESEGHHPDLHLTGYRTVTIELWTHAVGGLTDNDFILAAKIDQVPIEEKR